MNGAFRPAPRLAWRRIEDEVVLLRLDTSAYYSLNGTGSRVWELLCEGRPPEKAAALLAREYGVPLPAALRDVAALVRDLRRQKLLEPAP